MHLKRIIIADEDGVPSAAIPELHAAAGKVLPVETGCNLKAGDLVLSRISHHASSPLIIKGLTSLHNSIPESDAFQIFRHNGILYILGSSRRGVMQGIHEFCLRDGFNNIAGNSVIQGAFAFPCRIFSPIVQGIFNNKLDADAIRSCARYLSLTGASHIAATNDFSGGPARDLHSYVQSSIFPKASDRRLGIELRKSLRATIDAAVEFGLDILFDCRLLPCQGGPWVKDADRLAFLQHFPADVLSDSGTYQGKVLCFSHPKIQKFYEEVIEKFFTDFPEIELFHYLTMDAEGEFCDPETCTRCRGMSKFDQRDRLALFLSKVMSKARPGIRILNTGFQWDRAKYGTGQLFARQAALPENVGLCMSASGDSATYERQAHDALRQARLTTWRAGQLAIGRDALHYFEDFSPKLGGDNYLADYPFGVAAKIRRWSDLKFDGFYDVRGRIALGDLHVNSLACRAAMQSPNLDSAALVRDLASRWFGSDAMESLVSGWSILEQAQAIMSNGFTFPSSSPLSQYASWHISKTSVPLPSDSRFASDNAKELGELLPCRASGYVYHEGDYPARLETTGRCMLDAADMCFKASRKIAGAMKMQFPSPSPDIVVMLGEKGDWRPDEYLQRHKAFLDTLHHFYAYMGAYFTLKALYMRLNCDEAAYKKEARQYLKAYAKAARALAEHMDALIKGGFVSLPVHKNVSRENLISRAAAVEAYLL